MHIDLDESLLPWDLTLTIGKVTHVTKPVSLEDIGVLMAAMADKQQTTQGLLEAVGRLFVTKPAKIATWQPAVILGVAKAVCDYFAKQMAKNSQAIAATVDAAMASASETSGSSTPQS